MTSTEPLVRRSSGDHAATYIKRLIFDQHLRPGDRVPQDEVAQALGISRIPVREALIALEREGWITIEMHRGAFVNDFDEQAVRDHYSLFGLVYGFAARRALARDGSTGELAAVLDAILRQLGKDDDPAQAGHVALAFHDAVVHAARSPRIQTIMGAMSGLIPGNFFAVVPGSIPIERQGLTAIAKAVRKGNGDAAAKEYEKMMRAHGDLVVELFESRGFFATP
ncbi:MAG: transcriptional regulator, GntR family [Acidimicrobiales bacterium]|nr:transcriptional regulator, GntR family [Acidimicrobiales bacterium]